MKIKSRIPAPLPIVVKKSSLRPAQNHVKEVKVTKILILLPQGDSATQGGLGNDGKIGRRRSHVLPGASRLKAEVVSEGFTRQTARFRVREVAPWYR